MPSYDPALAEYIRKLVGAVPPPEAPAQEVQYVEAAPPGSAVMPEIRRLDSESHTKQSGKTEREGTSRTSNAGTSESTTRANDEYAKGVRDYAAEVEGMRPRGGPDTELVAAEDKDAFTRLLRGVGGATAAIAKGATDGRLDYSKDWDRFQPDAVARLKSGREERERPVKEWLSRKEKAIGMAKDLGTTTSGKTSNTGLSETDETSTSDNQSDTTGFHDAPVAPKFVPRPSAGAVLAGSEIPHFKRRRDEAGNPVVVNKPEEEAKFKKSAAAAMRYNWGASELINILEKDPSQLLPGNRKGEVLARYQSILTNLRLASEMGAPQAAELLELAKQLEDPTKLQAFMKDSAGLSGLVTNHKTNLVIMKEGIDAQADMLGLDHDTQNSIWNARPTSAGATAPTSKAAETRAKLQQVEAEIARRKGQK